ncbi:MAG: DUF1917 domain-containing protein [bacterium]|nr:DUF1917 domain-containing protein [bacterium]
MPDYFSQKFPSKVTRDYWIYAERKTGEYPQHSVYGGKWLIFVNNRSVDRIWMKIKTATEEGRLGGIVKVATAKINPGFASSKVKVICVYTYDWRDEKDVKRVREELKKIGIARKIAYKTDEDTEQGRYRTATTTEKISKYYK